MQVGTAEMLFIDHADQAVPVIDRNIGEIRQGLCSQLTSPGFKWVNLSANLAMGCIIGKPDRDRPPWGEVLLVI